VLIFFYCVTSLNLYAQAADELVPPRPPEHIRRTSSANRDDEVVIIVRGIFRMPGEEDEDKMAFAKSVTPKGGKFFFFEPYINPDESTGVLSLHVEDVDRHADELLKVVRGFSIRTKNRPIIVAHSRGTMVVDRAAYRAEKLSSDPKSNLTEKQREYLKGVLFEKVVLMNTPLEKNHDIKPLLNKTQNGEVLNLYSSLDMTARFPATVKDIIDSHVSPVPTLWNPSKAPSWMGFLNGLGERNIDIGGFHTGFPLRSLGPWVRARGIVEDFISGAKNFNQLSEQAHKGRIEDAQLLKEKLGGPGGVILNAFAQGLLNITQIEAVIYNEDLRDIVLLEPKSVDSIPFDLGFRVDPDAWSIAIRSAYSGDVPAVSIDPGDDKKIKKIMQVTYFGQTQGTKMGLVMFEADRMLKCISLGRDNVTDRELSVRHYTEPFIRGIFSLDSALLIEPASMRLWIEPDSLVLEKTKDGRAIRFQKATMRVQAQVISDLPELETVLKSYAQYLSNNYNSLAREWPVFEELRQYAQIVGIANWLRDYNVPINESWLKGTISKQNTPTVTKSIMLPIRKINRWPWIGYIYYVGGIDFSPKETHRRDDGTEIITTNSYIPDQGELSSLVKKTMSTRPHKLWRIILRYGVIACILIFSISAILEMTIRGFIEALFGIALAVLVYQLMPRYLPEYVDASWTFVHQENGKSITYRALALPLFSTLDFPEVSGNVPSPKEKNANPSLWMEATGASRDAAIRFTNLSDQKLKIVIDQTRRIILQPPKKGEVESQYMEYLPGGTYHVEISADNPSIQPYKEEITAKSGDVFPIKIQITTRGVYPSVLYSPELREYRLPLPTPPAE
ncbi:MAG: hypothetical protein HY693_05640, partial [Deltaproteobacteria bacterium]|nr:hypothetical protein [Deltaproteobacteria bacterium]